MLKNNIIIIVLLCSIINYSCGSKIIEDSIPWYYDGNNEDSTLGVNLKKAKFELLDRKNGVDVIIAMLDTEVDINHLELAKAIWNNPNEKENGKDDDGNGYIDDINGWNFLGNNNGENVLYQSNETSRIIKWNNKNFVLSNNDTIRENYAQYSKAKNYFNQKRNYASVILEQTPILLNTYRKELKNPNLPKEEFITLELLDSLVEIGRIKKEELLMIYNVKRNKLSLKLILEDSIKYVRQLNKYYNLNYEDRSIIGDEEYNLDDSIYGNNSVNNNVKKLWHGTQTAGVLKGLGNENIKLMPLCISSNGDEHDKDIFMAIRYAVNQGAKIINISLGKEFSLNEDWLDKALLYASENDVLIISSAGNDNWNLDLENYKHYPDDNKNDYEFVDNFIRVGASGQYLDNNLKTSFSNYGKKEVDIFAPGENIYTTSSINKNGNVFSQGTSLSTPIVSRIAALIRSYYPSLTAFEVKQILMDSSVKYDILVDVPTKENPDQQLPFNELSKSGGIVNAYNAMLMAEEYVKSKKKK